MSRRKNNSGQMTLFDGKRKTRTETEYRQTSQSDGSFSPKISPQVTARLTRYCKFTNQNKTKFVESCIMKQLDIIEKETYQNMSKDELIDMLMSMSERSRNHDDL